MRFDVLIYGREELRRKATPVARPDEAIRQLASDMLETMYAQNGIGLAAEQVGRLEAVCVVDVPPAQDAEENGTQRSPDVKMPLVLVNPRIEETSGAQTGQEGCLSFPEIFVPVKRAWEATVSFMNLKGEECRVRVRGLLARAVQHEIDHLAGVLLVDRMTPVQRVAIAGRLKRLRKSARLRPAAG